MSDGNFDSELSRLLTAHLPPAIQPLLAKALRLHSLANTYSKLQAGAVRSFPLRLLQHLGVEVRVSERDLGCVPSKGACLVVANHPFGLLEGAVLAQLLQSIRPDVRLLANGILSAIPELRDLIIPVDPDSAAASQGGNRQSLRHALRFLGDGGLLVVFPAGAVSHFQWRDRAVTDPEWNPAAVRLALLASRQTGKLPIVPVYIEGRNSVLFQLAGTLHAGLRTALLPRELLNKRGREVVVRLGTPVESTRLLEFGSDRERTQYMRWRTYLLASRNDFKPRTSMPMPRRVFATPSQQCIVPPVDPYLLRSEVEALPSTRVLAESGDLCTCLATAEEIPRLLVEIGRLRETAFREAGEGTGKPLDLDRFDDHYWHLFVWNRARHEVVGACRLASTGEVVAQHGLSGLYTAELFRYDERFVNKLGPALELGRSFIRREYQRAFSPLLLLWKGIGAFVAQSRYTTLFGPVSISNQYQSLSRELMLQFLEKRESLSDWTRLVKARNAPPRPRANGLCRDLEDLADAVSDLEPDRAGLPVLLRQYLRLGGKLIAFNVDPAFSNALDGLILVDLTRTEPKLLERYLGREASRAFLSQRTETSGTQ